MTYTRRCIHCAALECLQCSDPAAKSALAARLPDAFASGGLRSDPACETCPVIDIPVPGRPDRPCLVPPRQVPARGLGTLEGRVALVHAVAHIEFNAINLACDAVYRFREMPDEYYRDWVGVAADEARHFGLLAGRLAELGSSYGAFDAHDGLWQMAVATAHDPLARMALVPRVLEARGLDVTPGMIERLRAAGDHATADILEVILGEEVAHVAAGTRWFHHLCSERGLEPDSEFAALVARHAPGAIRPPFNLPARERAGFTVDEMARFGTQPPSH